MRLHKKVKDSQGKTIEIFGSNRWQNILIDINSPTSPSFVTHYKKQYGLDEFSSMNTFCPKWMKEFDQYKNDSFFSGILLKFNDDFTKAKVFTFIG